MSDRVGQHIRSYRLIRLLGKGPFSHVYLGENTRLNKQVAIKVLNLSMDPSIRSLEDGVERFNTEMRIIAHLTHPNILRVLDFGVEEAGFLSEPLPFLIMDYVPNGTLLQRHPKGSQVPLATIVDYMKQIAPALQYAHAQKVFHQSIKPENMLLGPGNKILLSDFSNVVMLRSSDDHVVPEGFYTYMAPEQLADKPQSSSDQYSLGVVVYEWLSGDIPYHGPSSDIIGQIINSSPPPLREKIPTILPRIEEVVMRSLAKDPKQRFVSVQEFADALEQAYLLSIKSKTTDRVGQRFGNYRLIRLLGRGGFAEVYLGQHQRLNTYAAIKVLHTHLSNDDMESFQKEAQIIANLKHPSIVRVLDFDVEGDIPFLVMDYAPNGTLRQRHSRGSRLSLATVVSYVKQVAHALQFAHDQKLIHRDIKPENMLLGANNDVLLSDFGIAIVAHSTQSLKTQDGSGTIYYMAPEQIQGKPRIASDQYALGVVVYEWLSGTRPFDGTYWEITTQHLSTPPPSLREIVPAIPIDVEQVVLTALAKDPHKRFASVQAFANALEQACQ